MPRDTPQATTVRQAEAALHPAVAQAVHAYLTHVQRSVRVPPSTFAPQPRRPHLYGLPRESVWRRLVNQHIAPVVQRLWNTAHARHSPTTTGDPTPHTADLARRLAGFPAQVVHRLRTAVAQGLARGESTAQLQQRVTRLATAEDDWAGQVATMTRTEATCALNAGALAGALAEQQRTGQQWAKRWQATPDERTRPTHRDAHGQLRPLNRPFRVGGTRMQFPGDPKGPPGEVINCRCTLRLAPAGDHSLTAATPPREETPTMPPTSPATPTVGRTKPANIRVDDEGRWRAANPLNEWTADRRMLQLAADAPLKTRPLPLPLLYQDRLEDGHKGARLGLSKVDKIWREGDLVVMEGTFDMKDPAAVDLARKVAEGYVRFVSLDVDMATAETVCVGDNGAVEQNCDPTQPGATLGTVYTDWRAMGATLLAHPAYPDAIMVSLAASAAQRFAFAAAAEPDPAPQADDDPPAAAGCVVPGPDGTWVPAPCDAEGAVPADETGTAPAAEPAAEEGPADDPREPDTPDAPDAPAESDPAPQADDDPPAAAGCVVPGPDGTWVPAPCDAEGAVPADETGTAPAQLATAPAPYQPVPLADTTPSDQQPPAEECVYPDGDGGWAPCDCQEEGAQPATTGPQLSAVPDDCAPCRAAVITAASTPIAAPGFAPPADWFADPQLTEPTNIHVDPETGRIQGHLAVWDTCHVGYTDRCITPPRSTSDYSHFNERALLCDDGTVVYAGLITMDTGHPELTLSSRAAAAHYDNTGTMAAVVRAGEDAHGIWLAGACLPHLTQPERLRLALSRFSGDWRQVRGNPELIAALAVPRPGFPVPARRTNTDGHAYALVAAGMLPPTPPDGSPPPATAAAAPPPDPAVVAALVVSELDRREARQQRYAAAAASLAELRASHQQHRVRLAAARIRKAAGKAPRPRATELPLELIGTGPLPTPSTHDIHLAKNWIQQTGSGHLPSYIRRISRHLREKGMSESRAIATAVNVARRMCRSGDLNFPGRQQVNAASRAEACRAVAEWDARRAEARAS